MGMAQRLATARDAVASADSVVLAVCDTQQLHDVLLGNNGIAASLEPGAVVVLTSTVGVDGIRATIKQLAVISVEVVDAPLSGGPARAVAGDLLVIVGASPAARERARPVLSLLTSTRGRRGRTRRWPGPQDGQSAAARRAHRRSRGGARPRRCARAEPGADAGGTRDGAAASFVLGAEAPAPCRLTTARTAHRVPRSAAAWTLSSRTQASSVTLPGRRVWLRPSPQPLSSCSCWAGPGALAPVTTPPSYGSWRRSGAPGRTSSHHHHHPEETQ